MPKLIDLTGQRFGRLEVIKRVGNDKWGDSRWLCQCDCKNKVIVLGYNLKKGNTKSCGCLYNEGNNIKHGHKKNGKGTGIYRSWDGMIQRCTNPNTKGYHNYGGRGITVCDRWLHSFANFLKDMIKGWKPGFTIERKDKNGNYCKDNCKWATRKQQARNRRDNLCIPYNGKIRLFVELCEEYNMPRNLVYDRFYRYGWTLEDALTTPVGQRRKKS